MEFGRLDPALLSKTNFDLPRDPTGNRTVLPGKHADTVTWLGNAKWGRKEWVGKLYPPKTPQRRFLEAYTEFYNSIELNATHYKIYGAAGISAWSAVAGNKAFLFCPKMHKAITHRGKLGGKAFLTNEFLRGIAAFKEHLGPVFIQFPETFGPGRLTELLEWLPQLPGSFRYFIEVRHPAWFSDKVSWQALLSKLTGLQMGIVITDTAARRDCCHMHLTIPATFIRFVGNSLDPTDYRRCDAWAERIGRWQKKGLKELYFFMHMHDETYSPELSAYLATRLNKVLRIPVQVPVVKPELATAKPTARGINEKFSVGLEAAIARREAILAGGRPQTAGRKTAGRKTAGGRPQTAGRKTAGGRPQTAGRKSAGGRPQTEGRKTAGGRPQTAGRKSAGGRPQTAGRKSAGIRPEAAKSKKKIPSKASRAKKAAPEKPSTKKTGKK